MKTFFLALAILLILPALVLGGSYGYTPSYSYAAPYVYTPSYYSYNYQPCYQPSYQYYPASYSYGRYYPAGYYSYQNGVWHLYGHGPCYGYATCPTAPSGPPSVAAVVPVPVPVPATQGPTTGLSSQDLSSLRSLLQGQQPDSGLTVQEVAQLKLLLRQLSAPPPVAQVTGATGTTTPTGGVMQTSQR
jgi:hypothetical protein